MELAKLKQLNHDLYNEVEIFRKNFEICKDRYDAVAKKVAKTYYNITKDDLPHYTENHEVTVTQIPNMQVWKHYCRLCNVEWTVYQNDEDPIDPNESYLEEVKNNLRYLNLPRLYAGDTGWVHAYKFNEIFASRDPTGVTKYTPKARKFYRNKYEDGDV